MATDILLQSPEALGNLGHRIKPPIGLAKRNVDHRICGHDSEFLPQVIGDFFYGWGLQRMHLLQEAKQQQPRAQGIDLARDTSCVPIDQWKAILGKLRVAFPIGAAQTMLNIRFGLGFAQRPQVVSRCYPLPQLVQSRAAEDRTKLRLPEQEALQRHCSADDDVGQHAQLFERFERQVLRLVDDQQDALAVALLGQHKVVDALEQCPFGQSFFGDPEPTRNQVQKVVPAELSGHDLGVYEIALVDRCQQVVNEDRFAGTDLPGDDNEAFSVVQTVDKVGHRLPMYRTLEEKPGIGSELKRRRRETVELRVHLRSKTSYSTETLI